MSGWASESSGREAGWQPDPTGRFDERFWNGRRWTPRVRVRGAEAIESDTASAVGDAATWRADPTGRFEQRLWNGDRWSRRVRSGDAEAVDILSVPAPPRRRRGRDTAEDAAGWRPDPSDPSIERYWDGRDLSAKTRPAVRRRRRPRRTIVATAVAVTAFTAVVAVLVLLALLT